MGKHKPDYSRHLLTGDYVIVVNAGKVEVTGNPSAMKTYYRHSGYVGNLRSTPMTEMLAKRPDRVIERTVKGMLPHNRLGRQMLRRLRVYVDATHPHQSQVNAGMGKPKEVPAPAPATAEATPRRRPARSPAATEEGRTPRAARPARATSRAARVLATTDEAPPTTEEAPPAPVQEAEVKQPATPRRRRATPRRQST